MQPIAFLAALSVTVGMAMVAFAQVEGQQTDEGVSEADMGQSPDMATESALAPAISTQLTYRSHLISANSSAWNLEGAACPSPTRMISGACHPGYNDRVIIINQFPNVGANTWRCGFRNNNNMTRTVWIYTLCAQ